MWSRMLSRIVKVSLGTPLIALLLVTKSGIKAIGSRSSLRELAS